MQNYIEQGPLVGSGTVGLLKNIFPHLKGISF